MKFDVRVLLIGNLLGFATLVPIAIGQAAKDPAMRPYRHAATSRPTQQKLSPIYKAPKLSAAPRQKKAGAPLANGAKRNASDAQVAALERETAKTQTSRTAMQKAPANPRPVPVPKTDAAEKSKPMNFTYQTPKNNATAGTMARPKKNH
ncbi:MAG TPA: hypothetical protein VFA74_04125 [Terriglobales bacterium]|nr:hypothetical protein [Terriglobales bacterium]